MLKFSFTASVAASAPTTRTTFAFTTPPSLMTTRADGNDPVKPFMKPLVIPDDASNVPFVTSMMPLSVWPYAPPVILTVAPPSMMNSLPVLTKAALPYAPSDPEPETVVSPPRKISVPPEDVSVVSEFVPVTTSVPAPLFVKRVVFVTLSSVCVSPALTVYVSPRVWKIAIAATAATTIIFFMPNFLSLL